jgi:hypothetical protein
MAIIISIAERAPKSYGLLGFFLLGARFDEKDADLIAIHAG